jgi:hypothetical protein
MEIKLFGQIKFSILLSCYQSQVAQMLVETVPQKSPGGAGLAMVGFQEIGVYYCTCSSAYLAVSLNLDSILDVFILLNV